MNAREMEVANLVGDGRGTLSLKKGRMLADILPGSSGLGPGMKGSGKGRSVLDDGVLADVTEAYGGTGTEPEGFRA